MMSACSIAEVKISADSSIAENNDNKLECKGIVEDKYGVNVPVWKLNDEHCYPVGIFSKPTAADECEYQHFHYSLLALGGHVRSFENGACGMATSEHFVATGIVQVKQEVAEAWNNQWGSMTTDESIFGFLPLEETSPLNE